MISLPKGSRAEALMLIGWIGVLMSLTFVLGLGVASNRPCTIITPHIKAPEVKTAVLCMISLPEHSYAYGLRINGANGFSEGKIGYNYHLPPRCREVPAGSGCLDWLEPGERVDDWDAILIKARKAKGLAVK